MTVFSIVNEFIWSSCTPCLLSNFHSLRPFRANAPPRNASRDRDTRIETHYHDRFKVTKGLSLRNPLCRRSLLIVSFQWDGGWFHNSLVYKVWQGRKRKFVGTIRVLNLKEECDFQPLGECPCSKRQPTASIRKKAKHVTFVSFIKIFAFIYISQRSACEDTRADLTMAKWCYIRENWQTSSTPSSCVTC